MCLWVKTELHYTQSVFCSFALVPNLGVVCPSIGLKINVRGPEMILAHCASQLFNRSCDR